ncbi:Uncharacterized protein FWK35_00010617 [Aphis craccivora]|uniref:C2H2-type domain-containing protein n=1 Tax=Aphis craccivora TaxID=307492 RepID=A0A6G0YRM0_APHCR|nr:Uncharacterized protein FWK35_00010617 [Aphis craccivora]
MSRCARLDGLRVYPKKHAGVCYPCTICLKTFNDQSNLNKHLKNVHGIINVAAHRQPAADESVIRYAPPVISPQIQIAPQIFVPDVPADGSTMISEDDIFMLAMDAYEMQDADTAARAKKVRMDMVKTIGFNEIKSSTNRKIVWYYAKNISNILLYHEFLRSLMPEMIELEPAIQNSGGRNFS